VDTFSVVQGILLGCLALRFAQTRARLPRMRQLWLDSSYNGRRNGSDWVETVVGWTVEVRQLRDLREGLHQRFTKPATAQLSREYCGSA
jgi:hypothetical protein